MTDCYAVIGHPISHSQSPAIHTAFAKATHQNIQYDLLPCEPDQFVNTVNTFREVGGKGLNVTLPFKQEACHYADELSQDAQSAGAVNTLWFRDDGSCYGHNTDGIGLINDLKNHGVTLKNKAILLLGAGGAARGALLALLREKPAEIVIVNRTIEKAQVLAQQSKYCFVKYYEELTPCFDIIINATSSGIQNIDLPLPDRIISKNTACYDMFYNKNLTCFLQWAKCLGATQLLDGKGMLVEQAAASFYLWRKIHPPQILIKKILLSLTA